MMELAFSPALGKQRREDQYEFKANLVYIASSRPAMVIYGDLVSKQQQWSNGLDPYPEAGCLVFESCFH